MKNKKMRYISRVETNGRFWWVRFMSSTNPKPIAAKTFPDLRYGGKRKALAAAQEWRDSLAEKLDKIEMPYKSRGKYRAKARSNTGVVGVSEFDRINNKGSRVCGFVACWSETSIGGRRIAKKKTFSVRPDDPMAWKEQKRRAIAWRKGMEKLHYTGPKK